METNIGLANVYKHGYRAEGKASEKSSIEGYRLLKSKGIPVTEYKGKVKIRGIERLVFEKARRLTEKDLVKKADEVLALAVKAGEAGLDLDMKTSNLGINKSGKVVLIDTNGIIRRPKKRAILENISQAANSLLEECNDQRVAEKVHKIKQKYSQSVK